MVDEVADEVPVPDAGAWRTEHRYRAVREVLDGAPVAEVARQYGTSRQALHGWLRRYEAEGYEGLAERSRRPKTSPTRLAAELESVICDLRHAHPRWGARRIEHELVMRGVAAAWDAYGVQPLVREFGVRHDDEQDLFHALWPEDADVIAWFGDDEEAFLARRAEGAVMPYALLATGGRWMDADVTPDYASTLRCYLDDLPDEAFIIELDCHS